MNNKYKRIKDKLELGLVLVGALSNKEIRETFQASLNYLNKQEKRLELLEAENRELKAKINKENNND